MQPPEYQRVTFYHPEIPMFLGHETPAGTINRLARDKFGLAHGDFDGAFRASNLGKGPKGYVFEVQVKFHVARELAAKNHPDVISVDDGVPPREHHFGARDPKELENHGKNRKPKPPSPR